jgi:trimeric autotransporter adhesin
MRALILMMLHGLFCAQLSFNCLAQPESIPTYVGLSLQGNSASASAQSIDDPTSVAPDDVGGLYVSSKHQNRIYHVAADGQIRLVAGSGTSGYSGDGGKATSAQLYYPNVVAVDSGGNLYIADGFNYRVRKVTPAGVISTVAGNGKEGFSGDGDKATSAQLSNPHGVAVDSAGNLYIADTDNNRIRKVTPAGVMTTVAGNEKEGFSGDGGQGVAAQLRAPEAVAVDSAGNLYIADSFNNRIRKVTPAGVITTVAGNGKVGFSGDGGKAISAQLDRPCGVAVDSAGNLYIADTRNHHIRKVTPAGVITTVAGYGPGGYSGDGGKATSAQLKYPCHIAVDSAGNLYIADTGNHSIRKVSSLSR